MQLLRAGGVLLLPLACGCARQKVPPTTATAAPDSADEFGARVVHQA
jgi:hypothetical protein